MPGGSFRAKWLELLTRCCLALGRPEDAGRAAACAETTAASMGGLPMAIAMADRAAAVIALDSGNPAEAARRDEAVEELGRPSDELHACGAIRYRDAADRELRRLGRHIHRRTRPAEPDGVGIESLTGCEHQIAELLVDRRTNPEIAEALFLSPKTVETHMRNIFRKLDVS